jgi:hypothetical protein
MVESTGTVRAIQKLGSVPYVRTQSIFQRHTNIIPAMRMDDEDEEEGSISEFVEEEQNMKVPISPVTYCTGTVLLTRRRLLTMKYTTRFQR